MATCGECGREINDGVWICGLCGAPVTDRGTAAAEPANYYEYAEAGPSGGEYTSSQYVEGAPVGTTAASSHTGHSRAIWLVGLAGLVIVAAIVLIWFFVLRGPAGGVGFAGTWRGAGSDTTELIIEAKSDGYELTIGGEDGKTIGPFAMSMVDGNLTTSLEPTAGSSDQQTTAAAVFKELMGSFSMVFKHRESDDTLVVSMGGATAGSQPGVLHRVH